VAVKDPTIAMAARMIISFFIFNFLLNGIKT